MNFPTPYDPSFTFTMTPYCPVTSYPTNKEDLEEYWRKQAEEEFYSVYRTPNINHDDCHHPLFCIGNWEENYKTVSNINNKYVQFELVTEEENLFMDYYFAAEEEHHHDECYHEYNLCIWNIEEEIKEPDDS